MAGAVATPEHASWAWPLFLATAAGLSTTAGALVAVIRKPSTQVMAGLLGVALGVMATVSILELLIKNAMEMDALLVCAACLAGGLAYYMLEPLFPKMEDHTHASAQAKARADRAWRQRHVPEPAGVLAPDGDDLAHMMHVVRGRGCMPCSPVLCALHA